MSKPKGNMKSYTLVELARVIVHGNQKGRENARYLFTCKIRDALNADKTEQSEASIILGEALGANEEVQDVLLILFGKGVPVAENVQTHFREELLGDLLHRVSFYWKSRREILGSELENPLLTLAHEKPEKTTEVMARLFRQQSDNWKIPTRDLCAIWLDERPVQGGVTAMGLLIDYGVYVDQEKSMWGHWTLLSSLINQSMDCYPTWKDIDRLALYDEQRLTLVMEGCPISDKNKAVIFSCIEKAQLDNSTQSTVPRSNRARL